LKGLCDGFDNGVLEGGFEGNIDGLKDDVDVLDGLSEIEPDGNFDDK
jgi:hypothetical protein